MVAGPEVLADVVGAADRPDPRTATGRSTARRLCLGYRTATRAGDDQGLTQDDRRLGQVVGIDDVLLRDLVLGRERVQRVFGTDRYQKAVHRQDHERLADVEGSRVRNLGPVCPVERRGGQPKLAGDLVEGVTRLHGVGAELGLCVHSDAWVLERVWNRAVAQVDVVHVWRIRAVAVAVSSVRGRSPDRGRYIHGRDVGHSLRRRRRRYARQRTNEGSCGKQHTQPNGNQTF